MQLVSPSSGLGATPVLKARWPLWIGAPVLAVALTTGGYWSYLRFTSHAPSNVPSGAKYQPVAAAPLDVKIRKDGELQAVNNIDILCLVEGSSTIVEIVKEGAYVKKGDTLVLLDSSIIRQKIEDSSLDFQRAESDLKVSKELMDIQKSQNAANLEAAQVALELAQLALQQYTDGTYPQDLANARTTLEMAKITVDNKESDLRQTQELYAKNFVTLADVKAAELSVTTVTNDLHKAETAVDVLSKYTHPMNEAENRSTVAQAQQKLHRTEKENTSNLAKSAADVDAKQNALAILKKRMTRYNEQLENCTIKAPAEGLVVYASSNSASSTAPIQEGTVVRERQPLLRLPDTSAMKAVVKVNETQVGRLAIGQRGYVHVAGIPEMVGATLTKISPVSDGSSRWWNPDVREYPVEMVLDWTPPNLKPGIGVQAEITIESIPDALAVPLAALYSEGADSFVFVRSGDGNVRPAKVTLGQSNETHVRLTGGVEAGAQVLLLQPGQGRDFLEKAGITPAPMEQPKHRNSAKHDKATPAAPAGAAKLIKPDVVAIPAVSAGR